MPRSFPKVEYSEEKNKIFNSVMGKCDTVGQYRGGENGN